MTIEQILDSARNEINKEGFKFFNANDNGEENFYSLETLYIDWAENKEKASDALWDMFAEECPEYF